MASVREVQVTFDCAEPVRVAQFWAAVLGYVATLPEPEDPGSLGRLRRSHWQGPAHVLPGRSQGKVVKNRVHLDVRVATGLEGEERLAALEAECARLIPLGATRFELLLADGENESCLVMQDVEGNEFCLTTGSRSRFSVVDSTDSTR